MIFKDCIAAFHKGTLEHPGSQFWKGTCRGVSCTNLGIARSPTGLPESSLPSGLAAEIQSCPVPPWEGCLGLQNPCHCSAHEERHQGRSSCSVKPEASTLASVTNIRKVWTSPFYLWSLLLWGRKSTLQSDSRACFKEPGPEGGAGDSGLPRSVLLEAFHCIPEAQDYGKPS